MKTPDIHSLAPIGSAEYGRDLPMMEDPNFRPGAAHEASAQVAAAVRSRLAAIQSRLKDRFGGSGDRDKTRLSLAVRAAMLGGAAVAVVAHRYDVDLGITPDTIPGVDTAEAVHMDASDFDLTTQHSPLEANVQTPDNTVDTANTSTTATTTNNGNTNTAPAAQNLDIEFSKEAEKISRGEGWYHQFSDMGIDTGNREKFLNDIGPELKERGLAYFDKDADEWRMKYNGGKIDNDDLQWIHEQAASKGYLEVQTIDPADVDKLTFTVEADNQPVSEVADEALQDIGVDNEPLRDELVDQLMGNQDVIDYLKSEGVITEVDDKLVFDTDKMTKLKDGSGYTLSDAQVERIRDDMQRFIDEYEKELTGNTAVDADKDTKPDTDTNSSNNSGSGSNSSSGNNQDNARDDKDALSNSNGASPSASPSASTSTSPSAAASASPSASTSPSAAASPAASAASNNTPGFTGVKTEGPTESTAPRASATNSPSPSMSSVSPSPSESTSSPAAFTGVKTEGPMQSSEASSPVAQSPEALTPASNEVQEKGVNTGLAIGAAVTVAAVGGAAGVGVYKRRNNRTTP